MSRADHLTRNVETSSEPAGLRDRAPTNNQPAKRGNVVMDASTTVAFPPKRDSHALRHEQSELLFCRGRRSAERGRVAASKVGWE